MQRKKLMEKALIFFFKFEFSKYGYSSGPHKSFNQNLSFGYWQISLRWLVFDRRWTIKHICSVNIYWAKLCSVTREVRKTLVFTAGYKWTRFNTGHQQNVIFRNAYPNTYLWALSVWKLVNNPHDVGFFTNSEGKRS